MTQEQSKAVFKAWNDYCEMEFADNNLYDQMFVENRMLDMFRQNLTKLQNIVNDIEEAV